MKKEMKMKKIDTIESLAEMIMEERNQYSRRVVILQDKVKDLKAKLSSQDIYIIKDGHDEIIAYYRDFEKAMTYVLEHNNDIMEKSHTIKKLNGSELKKYLLSLETAKFVD